MAGLPAKVQLHEKYRDQGLEVITVNLEGEEGMPAALDRLNKLSITTTNWCVAEAMTKEVKETLQVEALPAVVNVYDRSGRLWESFVGGADHDTLERMIEQLLARQ